MNALNTVDKVDINRYMGKWYEIASFPQSFQKGCSCTTAEYELMDNGKVKVTNTCFLAAENKTKKVIGKAWVTDAETNAKLKVQFFWPFSGKYWIIDLASDYSYAVVGHPNRKYLWILSRTPNMSDALYKAITTRIAEKGFDIGKLKVTDQSCK
ncbi:MAG: lipocalin family protein [Chitinophagaceae bacterium]|nr:lipocalin family protein [Chitinophagaceae bacterium]